MNSEERHYMGALVTEARSDRDYLIIDGQQRIATLSILALVIIDRLQRLSGEGEERDANRERAAALRARFIGEKDPASLIEASKLRLDEMGNPFYQDYLVQLRPPRNPRTLAKSCQRMWQCFEWLSAQLQNDEAFRSDGKRLALLLNECESGTIWKVCSDDGSDSWIT